MKRATFVVTMVLLLGSASVAGAECAWILWVQTQLEEALLGKVPKITNEEHWTIHGASPSHESCEGQKANLWGEFAKPFGDRDRDPGMRVEKVPYKHLGFSITNDMGRLKQRTSFYCLPDTSDPREKKE